MGLQTTWCSTHFGAGPVGCLIMAQNEFRIRWIIRRRTVEVPEGMTRGGGTASFGCIRHLISSSMRTTASVVGVGIYYSVAVIWPTAPIGLNSTFFSETVLSLSFRTSRLTDRARNCPPRSQRKCRVEVAISMQTVSTMTGNSRVERFRAAAGHLTLAPFPSVPQSRRTEIRIRTLIHHVSSIKVLGR